MHLSRTLINSLAIAFAVGLIGCCSPTTSEQAWNQSWELRYQEFRTQKRKVQTPQDAIELLSLALQAKGITYRAHIFSNNPRWEEAVYGAFQEMPYPIIKHQESIESYMKSLGYINKGFNSRREVSTTDQTKILSEFSRLLGAPPIPTNQAKP